MMVKKFMAMMIISLEDIYDGDGHDGNRHNGRVGDGEVTHCSDFS